MSLSLSEEGTEVEGVNVEQTETNDTLNMDVDVELDMNHTGVQSELWPADMHTKPLTICLQVS